MAIELPGQRAAILAMIDRRMVEFDICWLMIQGNIVHLCYLAGGKVEKELISVDNILSLQYLN